MNVTPKSDQEIAEENLWPAGTYDFEIIDAIDALSAKGNEMIKLTVRIYKPDGASRTVFDYLMDLVAYKIKHACQACGLIDRYQQAQLFPHDFIGKTGQCKIAIRQDKTGNYPDQNQISDYVVPKETVAPKATPAKTPALADDTIPF